MLLRWNENRLNVVPLLKVLTRDELEKLPESDRQVAITPIGTFLLYPGINDLDENEWVLAKPHVQDLLKRKSTDTKGMRALETVTLTVGKTPGVTAFNKLAPNQCKALIAETVNPSTLQKWELNETRESVRLDVKRKMEEIGIEPIENEPLEDIPGEAVGE